MLTRDATACNYLVDLPKLIFAVLDLNEEVRKTI